MPLSSTSDLPVEPLTVAQGVNRTERFLTLQRALERNAPIVATTEWSLAQVIHQAIQHPGGLFRAELMAATAEAYDLEVEQADTLACTIEYYHLSSLLLDDLPCMDDAVERRGRTCPHLVHGEAMVILGAMALINRAYLLFHGVSGSFSSKKQTEAFVLLEKTLGTEGTLNGQAFDLRSGNLVNHRRAAWIALRKTVPLIQLCLVLPAILVSAQSQEVKLLRRLAIYWGLAYQAIDDLHDVGDSISAGRAAASGRVRFDQPNIGIEIGVGEVNGYLVRLLRLADQTVTDLVGKRPSLTYLGLIGRKLTLKRNQVKKSDLGNSTKRSGHE